MARRSSGRPRTGLLAGILGCALALGSGGCSFLFVTPPPKPAPPTPPQADCSTYYTAPIVDTVLATLGGMISALVISGPCFDVCDEGKTTKGIIVSLPLFVLPTASAIYGYSKVSACRDLR